VPWHARQALLSAVWVSGRESPGSANAGVLIKNAAAITNDPSIKMGMNRRLFLINETPSTNLYFATCK
jgi:hypothetical protein